MKKTFSDMTQREINEMSDEEFAAVSPFEKKSCYDCTFIVSAVNHWCVNPDAIKARGTSIPACIKCRFWKPNWGFIKEEYKTEENGYTKPLPKSKKKGKPNRKETENWISKLFNFN